MARLYPAGPQCISASGWGRGVLRLPSGWRQEGLPTPPFLGAVARRGTRVLVGLQLCPVMQLPAGNVPAYQLSAERLHLHREPTEPLARPHECLRGLGADQ